MASILGKSSDYIKLGVGALVGALLTLAVDLYVEAHGKPRLVARQGWAEYIPFRVGVSNSEIAYVALDTATTKIIPSASFVLQAKGEAEALKSVGSSSLYFGTITVQNLGNGTATDLRLGVGYPYSDVEFEINASPNVKVEIQRGYSRNTAPSVEFPTYIEASIASIAPGEVAFITLGWGVTGTHKDSLGREAEPGVRFRDRSTTSKTKVSGLLTYYLPTVFFLTSKEARGEILRKVPLDALDEMRHPSMRGFARAWAPIGVLPPGTYSMRPFSVSGKLMKDEKSGVGFVID